MNPCAGLGSPASPALLRWHCTPAGPPGHFVFHPGAGCGSSRKGLPRARMPAHSALPGEKQRGKVWNDSAGTGGGRTPRTGIRVKSGVCHRTQTQKRNHLQHSVHKTMLQAQSWPPLPENLCIPERGQAPIRGARDAILPLRRAACHGVAVIRCLLLASLWCPGGARTGAQRQAGGRAPRHLAGWQTGWRGRARGPVSAAFMAPGAACQGPPLFGRLAGRGRRPGDRQPTYRTRRELGRDADKIGSAAGP